MKRKTKTKIENLPSRAKLRREHEAEAAASGAVVGAIVGASAGPPGAIAGAILGGVAGALAGAAIDRESSAKEERSRELDEEIGVYGGDIGAPNLEHPPPVSGSYSPASAGARRSDEADPAEGPMQTPDP